MPILGGIAALTAAVSWAACALFFTGASKRIGSFYMSHYRMLFGAAQLMFLQFIVNGALFPGEISTTNWMLLILSGLSGYFLTDLLLFQCYLDASPRIGILIFNFYPFASAVLAWFILGEVLSLIAWLGMAVTITGIIWVVLEKSEARINTHKKYFKRGVILAVGASILQAISFTLAKPAMIGDGAVDPLTVTFIRAIFGGSAFWMVSIFSGRFKKAVKKASDKRSMWLILAGATVGASFGVWFSMIAIKLAPIGIASTIMALMPVIILPMTAIVHKEKITYRTIFGAIVACLGVAILFNA